MRTSRRSFLEGIASLGGLAVAGCASVPPPTRCHFCRPGRIALQLYSIRDYIRGNEKKGIKGVGFDRAFEKIAKAGYEGVEFAGYTDAGGVARTPAELRKMLRDNGLVACGTHVGKDAFSPEKFEKTCAFELGYGNTFICCPGGGNMPTGVSWGNQRNPPVSQEIDDFIKRLCDYYNTAAKNCAKFGCKVGLHNHQWEFFVKMQDGTSFWDYFFSNTDAAVQMEQDVGWTTCAGEDPCEQYLKYPHRSLTLHAKENGMGKDVKEFDAILGQPGKPGAVGVDWDRLFPVTDADGVKWYVVECERHEDTLDAVIPSYEFLKLKDRT